MDEMTVISGAGPEDLIATVWFSLGYKPTQSLVLVGLEGPRHRVGMMLRTDLPALPRLVPGRTGRAGPGERLPPELLPDLVHSCLETVAGSGATAVLAVIADEQAFTPAVRPVMVAVQHQARRFGLPVVDVLGVSSTAFGSLRCRDPWCCPPGGRPIELVASSRSAVAHVVDGQTVAETEAGLLDDVQWDGERQGDENAYAGGDVDGDGKVEWEGPVQRDRNGDGPGHDDDSPGEGSAADPTAPSSPPWASLTAQTRQRHQWWARWLGASAAAGPGSEGRPGLDSGERPCSSAAAGAGLSAAMHDPLLRDAVLFSLLGADPQQAQALLDGAYEGLFAASPDAPTGSVADLAQLLRQVPERATIEPGRSALAAAVRVAAPGDRGPGLAVLAMLAWFEGRGSRARLLTERARADAPTVSLIDLVDDLLLRRVPPPWRWLKPGEEAHPA